MNRFYHFASLSSWFLALACFSVMAKPLSIHNLTNANLSIYSTRNINMDYSRAYPNKPMQYKSILMKKLLTHWGVQPNQIIELIASDNFSVFVPAHFFFRTSSSDSVAYLAIEPESKWPLLKNGTKTTAGPFQVIWTFPQYSHISDEYWAWSVTDIAIHDSIPKKDVIRAPKTSKDSIQHGYKIYVSHCASCHTINHVGKAQIGPDLNDINNPVRYYPVRSKLAAFIRNPDQFRAGRMSGSSQEGLSNNELESLIDYFTYMNLSKSN